jgi:hypothetical protein
LTAGILIEEEKCLKAEWMIIFLNP